MIYLSLPYFYTNKAFNNFIHLYAKDYPDRLKIPFCIEYAYGSFNWSLWNGGINCNNGDLLLEPTLQTIFRSSNVPMRIDFSNCFLSETDYLDRHCETILQICKDSSNIIDISDLMLMKHIQNNINNNFHFSISEKINIFGLLNTDIINEISEKNEIDLITIIDLDLIKQCKNKNKFEVIIGNNCFKCPIDRQLLCAQEEQQYQVSFSGQSKLLNCAKRNINNDYLKQIKKYQKEGITHFKIAPEHVLPLDYTLFNLNIAKELIKTEYLYDFLVDLRGASNEQLYR